MTSTMEIPTPKFEIGDRVTGTKEAKAPMASGVGIVKDRVFQPDVGGEVTEPTWFYHVDFGKGMAQMLEARIRPAEEGEVPQIDFSPFPPRCIVTDPPSAYPVEFLRAKLVLGITRVGDDHRVFEVNGTVGHDYPATEEEINSCVVLTPADARTFLGTGEKSEDASSRDGSADYLPTAEQQQLHGGWKGTPPAEGTRRALILDTIEKFTVLVLGDPAFDQTRTQDALADEIESALLKQTIADESEAEGMGV